MTTSPARRHPDSHKRNGFGEPMGIMGPSSSCCAIKFGVNGVKKSRSIAFETRNFYDEEGEKEVKDGKKKKEKGFWSKLLGLKVKNKDVLRHSKSMRLIEEVNMVS
ncbi:LMBR1-like membrane protein isoform 1 [Hibiscus syriacus]|uniref:LMBR1-like membrane protein isoform 1 n=1 Tax=Hibiscus syriacus TaxID=106335 RepID=A0A6A2XF23_HIBSY|nr:LMBR1-like membrane protein isoform 1 [Hibiscus syriacus]